jgi:hypothetical protein
VAAAGAAVYAALAADRIGFLVLGLGLTSVVVLAVGLARALPSALVAALAGLAAAWSVAAWTRGPGVPEGTILAAAVIFVAAELAFWSLDQVPVADEPELVALRAAGVAVRGAAVLALAAIVLATLGLNAGGGLLVEAVGVAASVGLVALVFALARNEGEARER